MPWLSHNIADSGALFPAPTQVRWMAWQASQLFLHRMYGRSAAILVRRASIKRLSNAGMASAGSMSPAPIPARPEASFKGSRIGAGDIDPALAIPAFDKRLIEALRTN